MRKGRHSLRALAIAALPSLVIWGARPLESADAGADLGSSVSPLRPAVAGLALSMTASPDPVQPGSNITYTITLTNEGPDKAGPVTVTDELPASTTFISCSAAGAGAACGGSGNSRTFTRSNLSAGGSQTFRLVAYAKTSVPNGTIIANTASASAEATSDPNPTDNSATATVKALRPGADLTLVMSAGPDPVRAGSTITYTLTLTNIGPAVASGVTVRDTLPASTSFVSCSAPGGSCGGASRARTISFPSLGANASATVTLVAAVDASTADGTVLLNTARAAASSPTDAEPGDNAATTTITVNRAPARRDIVLIVTDDQAWHTTQFMPQTSTLIGDVGVRFNAFFDSTPLCCPSRANIFSGQYSHNHGVLGNQAPSGGATKFDDTSTVATWLHDAGYRTGLFGKYLNQYDFLQPWPYVPPGWTQWVAFKNPTYFTYTLVENGVARAYSAKTSANYSTTRLAQRAVEFIEATPADQQLFVYYAPFAPHGPALPAPEDAGDFASLAPWRPPSYNEADVRDKPKWVRALPLLTTGAQDTLDRLYRRQVESLQAVDRGVASIVDALQRTGRLSNAAIVFTSDNGYSLGAHRWDRKNCAYDDCARAPLFVRAPGLTPRTDDVHPILNVDLAPTVAEWAGLPPPAGVNGISFNALLYDPSTSWREAALLEVLSGGLSRQFQAVRTSRYMYAEYMNGDRELYDLEADPFQMTNVVNSSAYAAQVTELRAQLDALRAQ